MTQLPRSYLLSTVRVGEHDLDQATECSHDDPTICNNPQDIQIETVVFHQNYSQPKPFQNDIAVIKLSREVDITDTVSLVCLPFYDDTENYLTDGDKKIITSVAGWGATTKGDLKIYDKI